MRIDLRIFFAVAATLALSMPVAGTRPALAQASRQDEPYLIKSTTASKYLRYYAPYAVQAAAAYLPVGEFDNRRLKQDGDGYGADVNYAVQNIFAGDVKPARELIKTWQYQFGNESYLTCIDPTDGDCQTALSHKGWDFGSGPAFQVWARTRSPHANKEACTEVSIAFRGTVGLSGGDWFSNLDRWGSPYDDYYHQLGRNIDGIINLIKKLDCYRRARRKPQIVSTGHSLGGGLAQFVALASKPTGARITKVFAFDPSPVTGAHLIDKQRLAANAQGLTIDRIYQEGEVLSYPRRVIEEYPPASSACDPFVRTVRIDAVPGGGGVGLHAMNPLATQVVKLSYDGDNAQTYRVPGSPANCDIRYHSPSEDGSFVASTGARQTLVAFVRNHRRHLVRVPLRDSMAALQNGFMPGPEVRVFRLVTGGHTRRIRKSAS